MRGKDSAMRPTIESFRALVALDEAGTVTGAAKRLGFDQSVITRRLQAFQRGDALLRRAGKQLILTPRGRTSLPAIRQLVAQFDDVLRQFRRESPLSQRLVIGTGSLFAERHLAGAMKPLSYQLPGWQLQVRVLRGRQRILQTADGTLDASVVSHSPLQIQSLVAAEFGRSLSLDIEPVCQHALCVVAKSNTEAGRELADTSAGRPINLKALARWPLAAPDPESGVRRQLESALADDARGLTFAIEGGNWRTTQQFAVAGLGVAILPQSLAADCDRRTMVVRKLPESIRVTYQLIYLKSNKAPQRELLGEALRGVCVESD